MKRIEREKTCAIYARVSTDEQTTDHQVNELKRYCGGRGFKIYKTYTDTISGPKSSRPALNELMFDARDGKFGIVVAWKLDRLGRSLQHLLQIVNEWKKINVNFICTSQQFDTTTPSGELIFNLLGAIAQFEWSLISERTKLGMRDAMKKGTVGRPKGSKDAKPRKKAGYYFRYAKKTGGI